MYKVYMYNQPHQSQPIFHTIKIVYLYKGRKNLNSIFICSLTAIKTQYTAGT